MGRIGRIGRVGGSLHLLHAHGDYLGQARRPSLPKAPAAFLFRLILLHRILICVPFSSIQDSSFYSNLGIVALLKTSSIYCV
jgi:hypothetical protein